MAKDPVAKPTYQELLCSIALEAEDQVYFYYNEQGVLRPFLICSPLEGNRLSDDIEIAWSECVDLIRIYQEAGADGLVEWAQNSGRKTSAALEITRRLQRGG